MKRSLVFSAVALVLLLVVVWPCSGSQKVGEKTPIRAPELIRLEPKKLESPLFVFAPNGKLFAYNWENAIHVYDLKANKEIHLLADRPTGQSLGRMVISPTGTELLAVYRTSTDGELWLWDLREGKRLRALEFEPPKKSEPRKELLEIYDDPVGFSPDGKTLVGVLLRDGKWGLQLWDAATGKKTHGLEWDLDGIRGGVRAFRFSEDGKTLVAEHWKHIRDEKRSQFIYSIYLRLWEVASGRDLGPIGPAAEVAFGGIGAKMSESNFPPGSRLRQLGLSGHGCRVRTSPTGRIMVFPRDPKDAALEVRLVDKGSSARLFDSVTGKELPKVEQLDEFGFGPIWRVTLSPDNKRLAACGRLKLGTSGEPLLTILLMDVSPWRDQALKTRKEPTAKELTAMWDDLGSDEPAKALQSLRRMRASSAQTILSFLKEHLRPVAYDTKRIPFYIARLGDKSFKIRAEAESELLKMAEHAEAALKKVLDNPPSLEERIRLQGIMDVLNKGSWPPPPARRLLWSIEFLERDATPAAVELLERMATGGPEAWVTHEAATSLERLGKGTKAKK